MNILFIVICVAGMMFGLCIIIASIITQQHLKALDVSVRAKNDVIRSLLSERSQ